MCERVRGAVRPSAFSLFTLKPRQVLLAELQKSSEKIPPMAEARQENSVKLKAQADFILTCSVALWLENKGLSKVLKRFISATQIQGDDWKTKALNLDEIFSKYTDKARDLTVESINESAEKQKDVKRMKKKSQLMTVDEKIKKATPKVSENMPNVISIGDSEVKPKKKKLKRGSLVVDDIHSGMNDNNLFSDKNTSNIGLKDHKVQAEGKSGKKKSSIPEEVTISGAETLDMENPIDRKSKKASDKAVRDVDESKYSKKRKKSTSDENENLPSSKIANEEAKGRKTKYVEPQITPSGANGHANGHNKEKDFNVSHLGFQNISHKPAGQSLECDSSGAEKLSDLDKSCRKNKSNSAEPKTVNAFQRVKIDEVKFVDDRLQDNSYWAKNGAETGYGAKAQEILGQVKGRDFRHEKTKKKRGSYRGGQIDLDSHSIKFNYSDEE